MIESTQNQQIKALRGLRHKKHRTSTGLFAAEGEDLISSAIDAGWTPQAIYYTETAPKWVTQVQGCVRVAAEVLASASVLGSAPRVIGVFEQAWSESSGTELSAYLDGVSDPGNIGTAIRSAMAFADGPVVLGPGCADPYSPKAVRASMGAVFHRPPARAEFGELSGLTVALSADATSSLRDIPLTSPAVVCVGAERDGLSAVAITGARCTARIPMRSDGPESLNAAMAVSIGLYELGARLASGSDNADLFAQPLDELQSGVQRAVPATADGGDPGSAKNNLWGGVAGGARPVT